MKSKVFFARQKKGEKETQEILAQLIDTSGVLNGISAKEFVAVKLTFGEKENKGYINPKFVRVVVDKIKDLGAKPFLTETQTLYKGRRADAVDHMELAKGHGFTHQTVNAPIIMADGLLSENFVLVEINKKQFKKVKIATAAVSADAIIGLAHFKGHMLSGFGGAIKNIGMGLANRSGKLNQHSSIKPEVIQDNCTGCWKCVGVCPVGAIKMQGKKAYIDSELCIGCGDCLVACKFHAISIDWSESGHILQERMTEYAYGAVKNKDGKTGFINFVSHITKECDCLAKDDPDIAPDIGILASKDMVALDKASVDLVIKEAKDDVFKKAHPGTDWNVQLQHAKEIGLGSMEYELIEV